MSDHQWPLRGSPRCHQSSSEEQLVRGFDPLRSSELIKGHQSSSEEQHVRGFDPQGHRVHVGQDWEKFRRIGDQISLDLVAHQAETVHVRRGGDAAEQVHQGRLDSVKRGVPALSEAHSEALREANGRPLGRSSVRPLGRRLGMHSVRSSVMPNGEALRLAAISEAILEAIGEALRGHQ